jgi:hypothetical protein
MPIVAIDEVEEGQTLAQGARVGAGAVLASPGTVLSAPLVERLKALGVTELDVRQAGPVLSQAEQLEQLELRFIGHDDDDLMIELKELVRSHIVG